MKTDLDHWRRMARENMEKSSERIELFALMRHARKVYNSVANYQNLPRFVYWLSEGLDKYRDLRR